MYIFISNRYIQEIVILKLHYYYYFEFYFKKHNNNIKISILFITIKSKDLNFFINLSPTFLYFIQPLKIIYDINITSKFESRNIWMDDFKCQYFIWWVWHQSQKWFLKRPPEATPHNVHNVDIFWLRCQGLRGACSTKLVQDLHTASTCV